MILCINLSIYLFIYSFNALGVSPGIAQVLLLALHSGIILGGAGGTYGMPESELGSGAYKANALSTVLSLRLLMTFFIYI